jgi:hypothetical protein
MVITSLIIKKSPVWDIIVSNPAKSTDVSEEDMASILRVELETKHETSMNQTESTIPLKRRLTLPGIHGVVAQKVEHF